MGGNNLFARDSNLSFSEAIFDGMIFGKNLMEG